MTQDVKLHILPSNHSGPVMQEPGAGPSLTYPKFDYDLTGKLSTTAMAYHQGVLYVNVQPAEWSAVDHDRAAALEYGERCNWPAEIGEKKRTTFQDVIDACAQQLGTTSITGLELRENRQNKLTLLNAHIYPKQGAYLLTSAVQIVEKGTERTLKIPYTDFDTLTVGQLLTHIRERLH